jgi:hypothetical protein
MSEHDVLVGLRFEVSGGLGRMSGRVMGKAGHLYLVQKQGAEHFELLELDDLRSAKFFRDAASSSVSGDDAHSDQPRRRLADQVRKSGSS